MSMTAPSIANARPRSISSARSATVSARSRRMLSSSRSFRRREHTTWHLAHDGEHNLAHLVIQLPHERQQLAIPGYHAAALPDLTRCCASRAKITRTIRALAAITTTTTGLDMATTVVAIPPMGNDRRA